nr:hypothetical protein GCM10010200_002010 [Actinomadura rugatobispora]
MTSARSGRVGTPHRSVARRHLLSLGELDVQDGNGRSGRCVSIDQCPAERTSTSSCDRDDTARQVNEFADRSLAVFEGQAVECDERDDLWRDAIRLRLMGRSVVSTHGRCSQVLAARSWAAEGSRPLPGQGRLSSRNLPTSIDCHKIPR